MANVLKEILRESKEAPCPIGFYDLFLAINMKTYPEEQARAHQISNLMRKLPPLRVNIFCFIVIFMN